jgi:hypothetical protein
LPLYDGLTDEPGLDTDVDRHEAVKMVAERVRDRFGDDALVPSNGSDVPADVKEVLRKSLASIKRREEASLTNAERVKRQYAEWVREEAYPALLELERIVEADGATTKMVPPKGSVPTVGIQLVYRGSGQPAFTYLLSLHERTGTERAFVMRSRTVPNKSYGWGQGGKKTVPEQSPFFEEHTDGRFNHAPAITREDVIRDFTRHLTEHRQRQWPE